jgi:hypothetical protein
VNVMREHVFLWAVAVGLAGLATGLLFEAAVGVNWGLWTLAASAAIALGTGLSIRRVAPLLWMVLALAVTLGAGAVVTAAGCVHLLVGGAVTVLLSMAVLLATDPQWSRVTVPFMSGAPLVAAACSIAEAVRRVGELGALIMTPGTRSPLRGAAMAMPVVALFGLILANADPVLATLRDDLANALARMEFVPRLAFFLTVLVGAVGGGGIILRRDAVQSPGPAAPPASFPRFGDSERVVVLGSVVLLFASFLLLQLSYLFGNAPARIGSGITFSEYARRGFGELTAVATLCALLLVILDGCAARGPRERWARLAGVVVIVEVQLLLVSALRRLWLYEEAYGFTTLRLYAHAYMVLVAVLLALLGRELWGGLDPARLARRAAAMGALALIALTYWNHEAWIVRENAGRYARTGQLDTAYLQRLSSNAVPAIVETLRELPLALAGPLREALAWQYSAATPSQACRWFEWNLRRQEAAHALRAAGIVAGPVKLGQWKCAVTSGATPAPRT